MPDAPVPPTDSSRTLPEAVVPTKPKYSKRFLVLGAVLLGVVVFGVIAWIVSAMTGAKSEILLPSPVAKIIDESIHQSSPTPTPFPFQEMTIPYLRQREFTSLLGELTKFNENESYTSFTTSFASDGFKVNGLLTIPKSPAGESGMKYPAIIFVHGYIPPQEYRTTVNYVSYVDYLARNGFVVFKIDLRGHDQSEGEPSGAYYSGEYVIDVLNARAALAGADFVDPQKIGFWGHSMAGNVTFRAMVASQNVPAVVIWAGAVYTYTDFSEYSIEDGSYQPPPPDSERAKKRLELAQNYGAFSPDSEFWKMVVPTNYLEGVTGAVQINHAVDDNVVSIEYSRNLMRILEGTTVTHELIEYPSGGHNLTGTSFTTAMQNTVEFFRKM